MPRTDDLKEKLLEIIDTIKGSGDYITHGKTTAIIPGLTIKGLGEVSFPIQDEQIQKILKVSHFASFGQGAETKLDPSIRKVKEIDAVQIEFCNEKWKVCIDNIVAQLKRIWLRGAIN